MVRPEAWRSLAENGQKYKRRSIDLVLLRKFKLFA
jgi:hypothetical protein